MNWKYPAIIIAIVAVLLIAMPSMVKAYGYDVSTNATGNSTLYEAGATWTQLPGANLTINASGTGITTVRVTFDNKQNYTSYVHAFQARIKRNGTVITTYNITQLSYNSANGFEVSANDVGGITDYGLEVFSTAGRKTLINRWNMSVQFAKDGNYGSGGGSGTVTSVTADAPLSHTGTTEVVISGDNIFNWYNSTYLPNSTYNGNFPNNSISTWLNQGVRTSDNPSFAGANVTNVNTSHLNTTDVASNLIPEVDNAKTIGNTNYYWFQAWLTTIYTNIIHPKSGNNTGAIGQADERFNVGYFMDIDAKNNITGRYDAANLTGTLPNSVLNTSHNYPNKSHADSLTYQNASTIRGVAGDPLEFNITNYFTQFNVAASKTVMEGGTAAPATNLANMVDNDFTSYGAATVVGPGMNGTFAVDLQAKHYLRTIQARYVGSVGSGTMTTHIETSIDNSSWNQVYATSGATSVDENVTVNVNADARWLRLRAFSSTAPSISMSGLYELQAYYLGSHIDLNSTAAFNRSQIIGQTGVDTTQNTTSSNLQVNDTYFNGTAFPLSTNFKNDTLGNKDQALAVNDTYFNGTAFPLSTNFKNDTLGNKDQALSLNDTIINASVEALRTNDTSINSTIAVLNVSIRPYSYDAYNMTNTTKCGNDQYSRLNASGGWQCYNDNTSAFQIRVENQGWLSGTVTLKNGSNITMSQVGSEITVNATGATGVQSVGAVSPIVSSGGQNPSISLNTVPVASGGTGATTVAGAIDNLNIGLQPYDFIVNRSGDTYYSMYGRNNTVAFSGTFSSVVNNTVQSMPDGASIVFTSGTYSISNNRSHLYINRSNISLLGQGATTKMNYINQSIYGPGIVIDNATDVKISGFFFDFPTNVDISDVQVYGKQWNISDTTAIIYTRKSERIDINKNIFGNSTSGHEVVFTYTHDSFLTGNDFLKNTKASALLLWFTSGNNTISNNVIDSTWHGVYLEHGWGSTWASWGYTDSDKEAPDNRVFDNIIKNVTTDCVRVVGTMRTKVYRNTCLEPGRYGISATNATDFEVTENTVEGSKKTFFNQGPNGIFIEGAYSGIVELNKVYNNSIWVGSSTSSYGSHSSRNVTVRWNDVLNKTVASIRDAIYIEGNDTQAYGNTFNYRQANTFIWAYGNNSAQAVPRATFTKVNFPLEKTDRLGEWNAENNSFTAAFNGTYFFDIELDWAGNATEQGYRIVDIRTSKDQAGTGTWVASRLMNYPYNTTAVVVDSKHDMLEVEAGETVWIVVYTGIDDSLRANNNAGSRYIKIARVD